MSTVTLPPAPPTPPEATPPPSPPPPSWWRRHRLLSLLALVVPVAIVAGALASGGSTGTKVTTGGSPTTNATAPPASAPAQPQESTAPQSAPAAPADQGPAQLTFGTPASVTEDGVEVGTITVAEPQFTTVNGNEFGDPPEHGRFALFTITATALSGHTFDVNPLDFYVRLPDGTHVTSMDGSTYFTDSGELHAVTLTPGETIKGLVSFDVTTGPATLVYAPGFTAIGEWHY